MLLLIKDALLLLVTPAPVAIVTLPVPLRKTLVANPVVDAVANVKVTSDTPLLTTINLPAAFSENEVLDVMVIAGRSTMLLVNTTLPVEAMVVLAT